jgi:hypothetical protein
MARKPIDRTGQRFHDLTAIRLVRLGGQGVGAIWECRCVCGKVIECPASRLVTGHSKSCGCRKIAVATARVYRHGLARHELYDVWYGMVSRCTDESATSYSNYGARGVRVCDRWMGADGLKNFIEDMGPRPPGLTLERKDNSAGYSPENCVWATPKQQALNRRDNRLLTFRGETLPVSAWSERVGIGKVTISERLGRGWSVEKALTTPVDMRRVPKSMRTDGSTTHATKTLTTDAGAEPITGVT